MSVRTAKTERKYNQAVRNETLRPIHQEQAIQIWQYWRIVENRFPHDKLTTRNHMLVLNREAMLDEIKRVEWVEFRKIIMANKLKYDTLVYNFPGMSSVVNIPHFHLYNLKEQYK